MRRKTNKLIRRLRVFRKKIVKLNRKKVSLWINKNLRGHPFVFGILFFIWISYIIRMFFEKTSLTELLKLHIRLLSGIFIAWFVLVILLNSLKDKVRTKWYFKKRFVFFMLILFYPLGLILLWTGSHFKKKTKAVFTVIFTAIFIFSSIYQERKYHAVLNMSPFDNVIETITSKKRKVFLKSSAPGMLDGLHFTRLSREKKTKLAVSDIYSRYSSSTVSIKTKDKSGRQLGLGSGFVVSEDGLIVTNSHVIESAYQAEIKIGERIFREVRLVENLPDVDIAILDIDADNLSPLLIGDSDSLVSGQFIVALGNPLGFEHSVSSGIISAIRANRSMKLIQMTVPISPGSSGGPVLNEYGEVIGIATVASFLMAQNLNFAIPINYLEKIIKQDQRNLKAE
ncbi:MAG: S1C family serine protease [Candidatus Omnitrophota bacterium]